MNCSECKGRAITVSVRAGVSGYTAGAVGGYDVLLLLVNYYYYYFLFFHF